MKNKDYSAFAFKDIHCVNNKPSHFVLGILESEKSAICLMEIYAGGDRVILISEEYMDVDKMNHDVEVLSRLFKATVIKEKY